LRVRFNDSADGQKKVFWRDQLVRHSLFAWLGVRPIAAQHSAKEDDALRRQVRNRARVVEIGVAEGASAVALSEAMSQQGSLHLVDPYHLSRIPFLNFAQRAAKRAVGTRVQPKVEWIQSFSHDAAADWKEHVDFLFIDGDHREEAVEQDWKDWHPHVVPEGVIAFHDARLFPGGWTTREYGPVRSVDRVFRSKADSGWTIVEETDSLVFVSRGKHQQP
jgi:predicted O-methyltransferase YrrM